MKKLLTAVIATVAATSFADVSYPIVDTAQQHCYDDSTAIEFPKEGRAFFGQDAHYSINSPSYTDNTDGTATDNVTGLMWTTDPGEKMTYNDAVKNASRCRVGGYRDWRLPTIKELYSLMNFNGLDPDPQSTEETVPFIDDEIFEFAYGDSSKGERIIDSQFATATLYESTTMGGNKTMFGVNFADGRIKGYPVGRIGSRGEKTYYVLYVRGNEEYGINQFADNGDGTVIDEATGLTWMQADSGDGMDWPSALEYAEEMEFAGYDDWRLPTAKELQSIVDYTRCPDTTDSAAIDPVFQCTEIENEAGEKDWGQYWTSTTHASSRSGNAAAYIAFGRSLGYMRNEWMDVHGAGSQRSDPKTGDASRFPTGRGPQGDVIRIDNMVRLVRGGDVAMIESGPDLPTQGSAEGSSRPERMPQSFDEQQRGGVSGGFMEREDRNGDGEVTRDEFRGPPGLSRTERERHFDRLDRNNDGVITEDEAPTGPPGLSGAEGPPDRR